MNQRTSLADAFGDVRRDLLQLDDVHRQRRPVHRDAEDLEELGRTVHSFMRSVLARAVQDFEMYPDLHAQSMDVKPHLILGCFKKVVKEPA